MKKMTYALIAVPVLACALGAVAWAQTAAAPVAAKPSAAMPGVVPTPMAQKPVTAAAPATTAIQAPVTTPVVAAPVKTVTTVTTQTTVSSPVVAPTTSGGGISAPKAAVPQGAPEDLRSAMQSGDFLKKLSFPLTEAEMVEFARASVKVGKINSKWDVQIASAATDKMAIEYSNLAAEESEHALKSIPGMTLEQYNELTAMTATDPEFNSIYMAYKQLVSEGAFGEVPKGGMIPKHDDDFAGPQSSSVAKYGTASAPVLGTTQGVNSSATGGEALPDAGAGAKLPSAPVNSGTAPAPQGSLVPPYSPPATR